MTKPGLKEKGSLLCRPFISYSSLAGRTQRHPLTSSNSEAGKDTKRKGESQGYGEWGDSGSVGGFRAVSETQKPEGVCSCNRVRVKKGTKQKTFPLLYGKLRNRV